MDSYAKYNGSCIGPSRSRFRFRLWRNLVSLKGGQEYMSTVCNRRARPNTKVVFHVDP